MGSFGATMSDWPEHARIDFGGFMLSVMQTKFGINGQTGILIAGARRPSFPVETERLLLNVAGNQISLGMNEAQLHGRQRHHSEELDRRVAQRTEELAATNQRLAEEIAERKRAEADLNRSAAFLAQAQRLSMTGSTWWNVSTSEIVWSEETYRLIGYPSTLRPTVEMTMERCHPDDAGRVGQIGHASFWSEQRAMIAKTCG
ncbi:hypothetical protein [Rhizobium tubonense]|uniref:hypothetical protein n=1 Tax=Rhizobium tubonense TaxID=484088 RepID=UPI0011B5BCCE|nr:hypothetical protein [Rhizobium tubonense]